MLKSDKDPNGLHIDITKLRKLFVSHLDRIYCAKKHMVERFPEIAEQANFRDLNSAILETIDDVKKQIIRMEAIYEKLDSDKMKFDCKGLSAMIEEAFDAINAESEDPVLRDMCILFYLQNMESIEVTSFQVLQMMAVKLKDPEIQQLLKENVDEAKDDRTLLLLITARYVTS